MEIRRDIFQALADPTRSYDTRCKVVIERLFNAPVELVWSIFTKPEYIKIWFGSDPNGMVLSADVDLSVGVPGFCSWIFRWLEWGP
jgi:uncharacterized protein YndB with AHSA1/START domain